MHIGILGAAFNPPHLGHILISQQVLDFTGIEKIWLLPVFKHTFDKHLAPVAQRVEMTKLIQPNITNAEVSLLEIDHQLDGNTINLIPYLKKDYPEDVFTFIIGSDNLPTFDKWGDWQALLKQLPFLVVGRSGFPFTPMYPGMTALKHPLFAETNISSTLVRERVKKGLLIKPFVTKEVNTYIKNLGLYKFVLQS